MMMRKMFTCAAIGVAAAMAIPFAAMAGENEIIEANGIRFEIPAEYEDLLTVEKDELEQNELVRVSETASVEAALASGQKHDGAGWLFSIGRITEDELKRYRTGSMDGMDVFAEDDDLYYVFLHPTDVRFVRESYDDIDEDMKQWGELNEWADSVKASVIAENPGLEPKTFSNTELDMYFCRVAYDGAKCEIRSLEFETLDASGPDDDMIDDFVDDAIFEYTEEKAPDGEYYVLYLEDEEVRLDFFKADENLIRVVKPIGDGEELETMYRVKFDDPDKTAVGIVKEWAQRLMSGEEDD